MGRENSWMISRDAPKSILGPLQYADYACNRKKHIAGACDIIKERYGIFYNLHDTEKKSGA